MLLSEENSGRCKVMQATTPEQFQAIYRLRYRVYVTEFGRMGHKADHRLGEYRDEDDGSALHLMAQVDGEVVACARLHLNGIPERLAGVLELQNFPDTPPAAMTLVSKAMVDSRFRSSTVFARLCNRLHLTVQRAGTALVFCTTFPELTSLYHRLGFRTYRQPYLDPDLGPHEAMVFRVSDSAYLRQIRSPLNRSESASVLRKSA